MQLTRRTFTVEYKEFAVGERVRLIAEPDREFTVKLFCVPITRHSRAFVRVDKPPFWLFCDDIEPAG